MMEHLSSQKENFMHTPVTPFTVTERVTAAELIERMAGTAFQARNLALSVQIWAQMFKSPVFIFFGLSGAMVPAGMRDVLVYLIENRLIDCLVSTGANLFHDLHETLGKFHWQGTPHVDDKVLGELKINRMYDVIASDEEYDVADALITEFTARLDQTRPYTTREYFYRLGLDLLDKGTGKGVITAAAQAGVPIYCPAVADSIYGMAVANGRERGTNRLLFDVIQDVIETGQMAVTSPASGVVYVGGGTPKNFIQQAGVSGYIFKKEFAGHKFGIQITTDSPQWGGSSGADFKEAQSWRKIDPQAQFVNLYSDATLALPIIVSALAESCHQDILQRPKPVFHHEGAQLRIEW